MKELIQSLRRIAESLHIQRVCDSISFDGWDESKHPRGNAHNAGQFAKKGSATQSGSAENGKSNTENNSGNAGEYRNPHITPEQDAAYTQFVERGDNDAALKMVREAAAKAMPNTQVVDVDGLPLAVYHGTKNNKGFYTFDRMRIGETDQNALGKRTEFGDGFYFTPSKILAESYAGRTPWMPETIENGNVLSCFVNIETPLKYEARRGQIKNNYTDSELSEYDGVLVYIDKYYEDAWDSARNLSEIVVCNNKNIKSADITYDDKGKVIPLSKRFNPNSADIRW